MKRPIFAVVFAVLSSGCGGGGGSSFSAATLYSCDHQGNANEAYCEEFSPAAQGSFSSADVDLLRANCSSGPVFSSTACSTAGRIGTCERPSPLGAPFSIPVNVARHHYSPAGTAERADCVTNFGDSAWTQYVECLGTETGNCGCEDERRTCSNYQWSSCERVQAYCDEAVFLGLLSGDTGDPNGDNWTGIRRYGDGWYTVTFTENDSTLLGKDITGTIRLYSPAGANFDLDVFCMTCGGALIQSSTNGPGMLDEVEVWTWDRWGTWQNFTVLIHVKRADQVCAPWDLYAFGNTVITTSNTACGG